MEKPDFEQIASFRSDIADHSMFLGFKSGCEHVWNTHVVPLLKDHHDNNMRAEGAVMRSEELESENKALQEKLKIADHLKELDDDAIVTLQKEKEELNRKWENQKITIKEFQVGLHKITGASIGYFSEAEKIFNRLVSENKSISEELFTLKNEIDTLKAGKLDV